MDLLAAREPLIIEHNGNRIAFIGCNPVGPDYVWASDTSPCKAPCDFEAMQAKIKELSSNGVLVIATLQDEENYEPNAPGTGQTASGTRFRMPARWSSVAARHIFHRVFPSGIMDSFITVWEIYSSIRWIIL